MTNTARVTERLVLLPLTERSAWLVGEDGFVEGPMPLVGLAYVQIELSYPVEMKTEQRLWTDRTGRTRTRTFTTLDRTSPGVPDDALSGADMDYAVRYGLVLPPDAGDWAAEGSLLVKMEDVFFTAAAAEREAASRRARAAKAAERRAEKA